MRYDVAIKTGIEKMRIQGVCMQNTTDYSPFGAALDGRTMQGDAYSYGFNGMEKDDEIKGDGNSYDFGARMYDSRIGRWFKRDFEECNYVPISPYSYGLNNPIYFIDHDGNTIFDSDGNEVKINKNSDGSITIDGTGDNALIKLIQDTWNDSQTGKNSVLKLDSKDVKVKITLVEKRSIWKSPDGGFGEVGGLSGEAKEGQKYTDEIEILATEVDDVSLPISDKNFSDFEIKDENGKTISEKKVLKIKNEIIESVKTREGAKKHKDHTASFDALTPFEIKNYNEASILDRSDKKLRNINSLIYETENVINRYGKKGEEEGKRAVGKAHQERKTKEGSGN